MKNPFADFVLKLFQGLHIETPEQRLTFARSMMLSITTKNKRSKKQLFDAFTAHVPADALRATMKARQELVEQAMSNQAPETPAPAPVDMDNAQQCRICGKYLEYLDGEGTCSYECAVKLDERVECYAAEHPEEGL